MKKKENILIGIKLLWNRGNNGEHEGTVMAKHKENLLMKEDKTGKAHRISWTDIIKFLCFILVFISSVLFAIN